MKHKTISELIPELNRICDTHGLEKKVVAYRNMLPKEHGYLKAYEILKEQQRIENAKKWN